MVRSLAERYLVTRATTEALASVLSAEDQLLQSMPEASPTKWHRAHTTWFFETFVLASAGRPAYDESYGYLFNSYYDAVGERVLRSKRGLLSRPSVIEVTAYRRAVDEEMVALLARGGAPLQVVELGLHHEEQHQELLLTDILHAFGQNPVGPVFKPGPPPSAPQAAPRLTWKHFDGGLVEIGESSTHFSFDNEGPRHHVYLNPYALASRPISVAEVKAFIAEGGYQNPSLWLADGFALARDQGWEAPLYVRPGPEFLEAFSLRGWRVLHDDEPAAHLSFWEADAVARFLGGRLPTEAEWEHAAAGIDPAIGNFADGALVPVPSTMDGMSQLFGDVWEWTRSSYEPYPGFQADAGALGEYNGKFMAQQMVLRGGSCLSPRGHLRPTYRNFWPPHTRFQMSGARLARDL